VAADSAEGKRYERYGRVLEAVLQQDAFRLLKLREVCAPEKPAFVTRVVRQLEQDGILRSTGTDGDPAYEWTRNRDDFSGSHWLDSIIYAAQIPRTPQADRPRERLFSSGAASLRTAELLAILVRSGRTGESALQAGEKVAARFADDLSQLAAAGRGQLKAISPAIGEVAYCQIMAGIELGRRVAAAEHSKDGQSPTRIRSTSDALAFCEQRFKRLASDAKQEELHVVTLSTQLDVINVHRATIGILDSNELHPREVFRPAIQDAAKAVILVHNHPSGDPTPSRADLEITVRLEEAGKLIDIQVLDHVIVARNGQTSIQQHRQISMPQ